MQRVRAEHLSLMEHVRLTLEREAPKGAAPRETAEGDFLFPRRRRFQGGRAFSARALTDRVILLHDRRTVMRREASEIPHSCVVMGDQPLRWTAAGLYFSVRVESVVQSSKWADIWPVLGITRVSPERMAQKGYPPRAEWCGSSVCAGGDFEAFAQESEEHLTVGFRSPDPNELRRYQGPFPRWKGSKAVPWKGDVGDVFGLLWSGDGHLHLTLNYEAILSADVGSVPVAGDDYYALVDCRGNVSELTLLPYEAPLIGLVQELGLQPQIDRKAMQTCVRTAASRALSDLRFAVTIADPSQPDVPLIAVSEEFEKMTGYTAAEILGQNCRFLNYGCPVDPGERAALRKSCQTGQPFIAILQNRRQSGEAFANLLSLRGLRVARDIETGEDIWYLVAIQADVTDLALLDDGRLPQDWSGQVEAPAHLSEQLRQVTDALSGELRREFASIARAGRGFSPGLGIMSQTAEADVASGESTHEQLSHEELLGKKPASVANADRGSDHRVGLMNQMCEADMASGKQTQIAFPTSRDRQNAPKPIGRTSIALLPEAEWMDADPLGQENQTQRASAPPRTWGRQTFPQPSPLSLAAAAAAVALASVFLMRRLNSSSCR
jgi:hypothetical protein